jgi:hypothetical protein
MNAEDKGEGQRRTLSDDDWKKIMKASGLPPEARGSIELAIRSYRALADLVVVPPSEIKEILRRLRDQTSALLKGLEEVLRYDDVLVGPGEWHPRSCEQRKGLAEHRRIEKERADLSARLEWLDQKKQALSRHPPGPSPEKAANVWLFVDSIDNALHHYTSKGLTRSKRHRRMMEQIFAIVAHKDHKVGRGTIDTAMRQVIDASRSRRAAKLLLPGSRH